MTTGTAANRKNTIMFRSFNIQIRASKTRFPCLLAGLAAGLAIAMLPLRWSAVSIVALPALLLSLFRPDLTLYLFFAGLTLLTDYRSRSDGIHFAIPDADLIQGLPSVMTLFFLLMLISTVFRSTVIERRRPSFSLFFPLLYAGVMLFALATGISRGNNRELLQVDFIGLLLPPVCFWLCLTILDTREKVYRLLAILFAAGTLKALILCAYYLAGRGWTYGTYRIVTLDSADLLIFITTGLLALHLLLAGRLRGLSGTAAAVACLPMLFAIIFSFRRAQWIGCALAGLLLFFGASAAVRRRLIMLGILAVCTAASVAGLGAINQHRREILLTRLASITDKEQPSNVYHILESKQTLKDLSHRPLTGLGLGGQHSPLGIYEDDAVPTNVVHNTFLYIWMKLGLPGLLFFTVAALIFIRKILRFLHTETDSQTRDIALPLAASTGLWFAMFLTSPIPWYLHQTFIKAMIAATVIALIRFEKDGVPS